MITFFTDPQYGLTNPTIQSAKKPVVYGVVNEREVRVVAGLMFAIGLSTLLSVVYTKNIFLAALVVPLFLFEFSIKVLFGPQKSILAPLVRPLIAHMQPEWVGAIQKRFAWSLGAVFAAVVLILLFVVGMRGPLVFILCSICLTLMWLESAAGICLGCEMYARLIKKGSITPQANGPKCAGGVCDLK